MSGLLQKFKISTDTTDALKIAVQLPFFWDRKGATHYSVGTTPAGFQWIELCWHRGENRILLPFPLTDADKVYSFLYGWLANAEYGPETDTDGSVTKGWILDSGESFYAILRLQTDWIVYSK